VRDGVLTVKSTVSKIDKSSMSSLKDNADYMCYLSSQSLMVCRINKPTEALPYKLEYFSLIQEWVQIDVKDVENPKPSFKLQMRNGSLLKLKSSTLEESLRWIADFEKILKKMRTEGQP